MYKKLTYPNIRLLIVNFTLNYIFFPSTHHPLLHFLLNQENLKSICCNEDILILSWCLTKKKTLKYDSQENGQPMWEKLPFPLGNQLLVYKQNPHSYFNLYLIKFQDYKYESQLFVVFSFQNFGHEKKLSCLPEIVHIYPGQ